MSSSDDLARNVEIWTSANAGYTASSARRVLRPAGRGDLGSS